MELSLSTWVSVSLLLLGNALLLYHMVRKSSFEMSERTAAVLTICLNGHRAPSLCDSVAQTSARRRLGRAGLPARHPVVLSFSPLPP